MKAPARRRTSSATTIDWLCSSSSTIGDAETWRRSGTGWQPLPVPRVRIVHFLEPDGADAQVLYLDQRSRGEQTEIPDELYMRELVDLDLRDARVIWRFCEEFGHLGSVRYVPDYPFFSGGPDEYASLDLGGTFGFVREAQALRNCVRIWDSLQGDLGLALVRQRWEGPLGLIALDDEDFVLDTASLELKLTELEANLPTQLPESLLSSYLATTLNRGLRAFPVHLSPESVGIGRPTSADSVNLRSGLCLQFANHIAEHARYSTCQNESCRRKFVRQRGRARMGQHRTVGVDFCSRHCAWAQGQRELRRRKKAQRADENRSLGA
jgi:hypothetical protein